MYCHTYQKFDDLFMQVQGVVGHSVLAMHKPFDLVKGYVIDMLHCVIKGVVPNLMSFWFGDSNKREDFSI